MVVANHLVGSSNFGAGRDSAVGGKGMPFRQNLVEDPPVVAGFVVPALDGLSSSTPLSVRRSPLLIWRGRRKG